LTPPSRRRATFVDDVRGGVRLVADGVHGVSRIAEGLHQRIASVAPPLGTRLERPARGIAGFVYRAVRGGATLAAHGCDAALRAAQPWLEARIPAPDAPTRDAVVSAVNGVLGGHLERTGNPLAIRMSLHPAAPTGRRVLLLVHGLCMNEQQWQRAGHDHGQALARDLGCVAVYLRYNTGRHVAANGLELAGLLQAALPAGTELDILAHSMGGLVARGAVRQAQDAGMDWPKRLRRMVFLGTPHHGALLEQGGNWLHGGLGLSPYLAPFTRLSGLRSEGITDLRHGNLLPGDTRDGRFARQDAREPVPLPDGVACYAVAGAVGKGRIADGTLGDGLVTVASALGEHADPARRLHFARSHRRTARGVHHLELLSDPEVYDTVLGWLRQG
jgi:pimeloyl-ACP methyl ester carboxylesterase